MSNITGKTWKIYTNGDPLGTIRHLLQTIWAQAHLDGMLIPMNGSPKASPHPYVLDDPSRLEHVNPFKPLMVVNAARMVPDLLKDYPQTKLGLVLRPCEMRSLVEMVKHDPFDLDSMLTICLDCLGTYPADEYNWRASRKESTGELYQDGLQFARQGGMLAYRYRAACQICASPQAMQADINIHVLGLPVRQLILIHTCNEEIAHRLEIEKITDGLADNVTISQHEKMTEKILERHQRTMERITEGLGDLLPKDMPDILEQLENCDNCQSCMKVCPICSLHYPNRDKDGHYERESVTRWLVSCSGCGMCEQACPNHLPLSIIFGHIHNLLAEEYDYNAGQSFDQRLPI